MTVTDPKLLPPPPGWEPPTYPVSFTAGGGRWATQTFAQCDKCGALVKNRERHTEWHLDDVKAYRLVNATFAVMMRDVCGWRGCVDRARRAGAELRKEP